MVIHGAAPNGSALCCDTTEVSPLICTGQPQPFTADVYLCSLWTGERRKAHLPELQNQGSQKLVMLGSGGASCLLQSITRLQRAFTALGQPWPQQLHAATAFSASLRRTRGKNACRRNPGTRCGGQRGPYRTHRYDRCRGQEQKARRYECFDTQSKITPGVATP